MVLNDPQVREEIANEIRNDYVLNENKNTMYKNL